MKNARKIRSRRSTALFGALLATVAMAAMAAPASAAVPIVRTGAATAVTPTTATLNGRVRTDVVLNDCHFEYVTPAAYRATGFTDLSSGGSPPCVPAAASVLANNTEQAVRADIVRPAGEKIVFRLVAANADGTAAAATAGIGFGLTEFDGGVFDELRVPVIQAGDHPDTGSTTFFLTTTRSADDREFTVEDLKDAVVELPPGFVGNPQVLPTCTAQQLANSSNCPPESRVGTLDLWVHGFGGPGQYPIPFPHPVFNMERPHGRAAVFAFNSAGVLVFLYGEVRTGGDYGVTVTTLNAAQTLPFGGATFTFWGVPSDHGTGAPARPFLSLPTSCTGPVETFLTAKGWLGGTDRASFITAPGGTGCNALAYPDAGPSAPSIEARPTTNVADAPSGLDVDLKIPQSDDPNGLAAAHLRDTTVTLPEGLVINPSGANGLDGCSLSEFGYTSTDPDGTIHTTPDAATCPDASKVAEVEVSSPLLDHPLRGSAHIADPFANPFNSLLALYITIDDSQSGVVAKLAGKVTPDPSTGQLTTTFNQNPQLPFENFKLNFKAGAHGALRTPAICGNHTTTSSLTPWSAPDAGPVTPSDTWAINQGCVNSFAEQPHAPSFDAGAVSPIAGTHSPFVVHLRREDGSQNFSAVTVRPPLGLTAKLAGTPACSDAALAAAAAKSGAGERASPSCPASSAVGNVTAGAGAGPAPYYAHGKVYLAGPYKGAPISLATIIPATAGPFDLGTVVTRIAAHINPATAEITAVSDQIPHILQGIPLDVRTVSVALDKPQFSLNPTSCDPMAVTGQLLSTIGALANLESRFQLGECTSLGFKPRMALRLKGGTKRGKHPQLTAFVLPRAGDANIRSVSVAFPRSEFLENAHIRTICTRPDFAADRCPAGAVYGSSTVFTPLLDYPLTGNVYLRSSDNLLPDVVPDLRGPAHQPIRIEASGRTDSVRGGIRNTFDFFPDAPFSRAILRMQGGKKGLLVNSRNICARTYRALVKFTAHNGDRITRRPKVVAVNCKNKRRKAKRRGHRRGARIAHLSAVR